jgi:RHS repeat-associated protein
VNGRAGCYAFAAEPRVKFTGKERDVETGLDYFGARYLSGVQGRFTSPDPYIFQNATSQHASDAAEQNQLRDRYISSPQVWNKYAYGLNNPLKFIDPDGKCSQPTNQKEGETGICVEAFIAQNWFKVVGRGDNRGFSGTNKDLTARSRVKLTVSKDGKVTSEEVESARSGVVVKGMGLRGDTVAKTEAKANEDGSVSVHVSLWGRNGEAFLAPLAPSGVLQGHFNLNISKSGQVSIVPQGSSATTFPSWGVYGYGSNGRVQTVKEIPERKIEDLQKPPVPIR